MKLLEVNSLCILFSIWTCGAGFSLFSFNNRNVPSIQNHANYANAEIGRSGHGNQKKRKFHLQFAFGPLIIPVDKDDTTTTSTTEYYGGYLPIEKGPDSDYLYRTRKNYQSRQRQISPETEIEIEPGIFMTTAKPSLPTTTTTIRTTTPIPIQFESEEEILAEGFTALAKQDNITTGTSQATTSRPVPTALLNQIRNFLPKLPKWTRLIPPAIATFSRLRKSNGFEILGTMIPVAIKVARETAEKRKLNNLYKAADEREKRLAALEARAKTAAATGRKQRSEAGRNLKRRQLDIEINNNKFDAVKKKIYEGESQMFPVGEKVQIQIQPMKSPELKLFNQPKFHEPFDKTREFPTTTTKFKNQITTGFKEGSYHEDFNSHSHEEAESHSLEFAKYKSNKKLDLPHLGLGLRSDEVEVDQIFAAVEEQPYIIHDSNGEIMFSENSGENKYWEY